VAFSPDGQLLTAKITNDGKIASLWDAQRQAASHAFGASRQESRGRDVEPGWSGLLAVNGDDGSVWLGDTKGKKQLIKLQVNKGEKSQAIVSGWSSARMVSYWLFLESRAASG
jgi:WD40 repeat protein